jgi:hypothetical protein
MTMVYLAVALITIVAVELFLRLPLARQARELTATLHKVTRVITSSAISDHWKEKVLLRYSGSIAMTTLKIGAIIGGIGLAIFVLCLLADMLPGLGPSSLEVFASWTGIGLATVVSTLYYLARSRLA